MTTTHKKINRKLKKQEAINAFLEHIVEGKTIPKIAEMDGMPTRKTWFQWLCEDKELQRRYSLALSMRADTWFEQTIEIADEPCEYVKGEFSSYVDTGYVANKRIRIDVRKWAAGKAEPKKYGDTMRMESKSVTANVDVNDGDIFASVLNSLIDKLPD